MPHKLCKMSARSAQGFGGHSGETHRGLHHPPPVHGRGLKAFNEYFCSITLVAYTLVTITLVNYIWEDSSCFPLGRATLPTTRASVYSKRPHLCMTVCVYIYRTVNKRGIWAEIGRGADPPEKTPLIKLESSCFRYFLHICIQIVRFFAKYSTFSSDSCSRWEFLSHSLEKD